MFLYEISYEQGTAGMSRDLHIIIKAHLCSRPKLGIRLYMSPSAQHGLTKNGWLVYSELPSIKTIYMFWMSAVDTRRHLLGF